MLNCCLGKSLYEDVDVTSLNPPSTNKPPGVYEDVDRQDLKRPTKSPAVYEDVDAKDLMKSTT